MIELSYHQTLEKFHSHNIMKFDKYCSKADQKFLESKPEGFPDLLVESTIILWKITL